MAQPIGTCLSPLPPPDPLVRILRVTATASDTIFADRGPDVVTGDSEPRGQVRPAVCTGDARNPRRPYLARLAESERPCAQRACEEANRVRETVGSAGGPSTDEHTLVALTFDVDAESGWLGQGDHFKDRLTTLSEARYGVTRGLPRILSLLAKFDASATFYVPGFTAESHPQAIQNLLAAGHEVAHHGYLHKSSIAISDQEQSDEIARGIDALRNSTGAVPRGYRSPAWELTPATFRLLCEHGFRYDSSMMGDDRPYIESHGGRSLLELPVHWTLDDWPYFAWSEYVSGGRLTNPREWADIWYLEFEAARTDGRAITYTMHPEITGRGGRMMAFEGLLTRMVIGSSVRFVTHSELADIFEAQPSEQDLKLHGGYMSLIDSHCHTGNFSPLFTGNHESADLVSAHEAGGVTAGLLSILSGDMVSCNDATRAACEQHPGHLFGAIYLDPTDVDGAIAELDRCTRLDFFRGVKLHPSEDAWFPYMEQYYPVYERIEALGLPILFHSGTYPHSNPLAIAMAARDFTGVPFILGHFGLADLSWECFPAAALSDNIYVDTTSNPMVRVLGEWVERFGAERMLWGSDFPFYDVGYEGIKIDYITASARDRELIGSANARRLYLLR